jgi:hypothetical protein
MLGSGLAAALVGSDALAQQPLRPVLSRVSHVAQVRHQGPELVPAPEPTPKQTDRFAPISQLTLDTSMTPGLYPKDLAAETLGREPPLVLFPGMTRPWPPQAFCWYGVPLRYAPFYDHFGYGGHGGLGLPCGWRASDVPAQYGVTMGEYDRPGEMPPPSGLPD